MHIFLSPHFDDAVLSCGGLIHQLRANGEEVLIYTVMGGVPQPPYPNTPLIQDLHQRWNAGEHPIFTRREEDIAAAKVLDAETFHDSLLDCPYRVNKIGTPLYPVNSSLFGEIHPSDLARQHTFRLPDNTMQIYAPLGAGGHVDHLLCNQLARNLSEDILFYEEYPYSASGGEGRKFSDDPSKQIVGSKAVNIALGRFSRNLEPKVIKLSEQDLENKIQAIACHQSQISTFWTHAEDMAKSVRRYAREVDANATAGAERLWL